LSNSKRKSLSWSAASCRDGDGERRVIAFEGGGGCGTRQKEVLYDVAALLVLQGLLLMQ
jgi:hypothetical protein